MISLVVFVFQAQKNGCTRIVTSSGGNAGFAAAYAARKLGIPITIYIPGSTPLFVKDRLEAEVLFKYETTLLICVVWYNLFVKVRLHVMEMCLVCFGLYG
jgi:hypothetical protein